MTSPLRDQLTALIATWRAEADLCGTYEAAAMARRHAGDLKAAVRDAATLTTTKDAHGFTPIGETWADRDGVATVGPVLDSIPNPVLDELDALQCEIKSCEQAGYKMLRGWADRLHKLTWALTLTPPPSESWSGDGQPALVVTVNFLSEQVKALADHWSDPEFWKVDGARMDSQDCAGELRKLIGLAAEAPVFPPGWEQWQRRACEAIEQAIDTEDGLDIELGGALLREVGYWPPEAPVLPPTTAPR